VEETMTLKYVEVVKMECVNKSINISKRAIDSLIESAIDYSKILEEKAASFDSEYLKLQCEYKSKELKKIADDLIEKTGYCKECKNTKKSDDVGMGSFEIIANRNRSK
jgi:restriction endonuclease Mrr